MDLTFMWIVQGSCPTMRCLRFAQWDCTRPTATKSTISDFSKFSILLFFILKKLTIFVNFQNFLNFQKNLKREKAPSTLVSDIHNPKYSIRKEFRDRRYAPNVTCVVRIDSWDSRAEQYVCMGIAPYTSIFSKNGKSPFLI